MVRLIQQKTVVGPKGQVVIPKIFRDFEKISPGSEIVFELKDDGILIKKEDEQEQISRIRQIAQSISKKHKKIVVDSDSDYERMLGERWKKASM